METILGKAGMYGGVEYGNLLYGQKELKENDIIVRTTPNLMKYLPYYYHQEDEKIMESIQGAIEIEIGNYKEIFKDLKKQYFISTATWGLRAYEEELGLIYNPTASYEDRREIIRAKLRGRGTTTVDMIKNTAESFSGGAVDVIEVNEGYYFIVKFIGQKGIPKNLDAFRKMLEDIKPAHLGYQFEFILMTWGMVKHLGITWGELKENKINWREFMEYRVNEINEEEWDI